MSAILFGLRISLGVGVLSTSIAVVVGLLVGLLAAYKGRRWDSIIMRVVDIQLSFPAILIALILLAVLGQGVGKIIAALVTVQWAYYARTVRGAALAEKEQGLHRCCRGWHFRQLASCSATCCPIACHPHRGRFGCRWRTQLRWRRRYRSWGSADHRTFAGFADSKWLSIPAVRKILGEFFPGVCLAVDDCRINLVADQLRDVLNPRLAK